MDVPKGYEAVVTTVRSMRGLCLNLLDTADANPCLESNLKRILSSLEMIRLNFPEVSDMEVEKG